MSDPSTRERGALDRFFAEELSFRTLFASNSRFAHIILQNMSSQKYQFNIGENLQGFEIKLDTRCTETGRMSIEVAEKSRADSTKWTPSGIYREDNSWAVCAKEISDLSPSSPRIGCVDITLKKA